MICKEVTVKCPQYIPRKPEPLILLPMSKFKSSIWIENDNAKVSKETDLFDFFNLKIEDGSKIKITADGPDESEAVETLTEFFNNFYLDVF